MFRKIVIANRGEIAVRIARTARRLGVSTVAVYSDADAGSAHVMACDEAVHIGGSQPAESYLRAEVIIAAAKATGAQGIHPGYGFLSENPEFVEACDAAGLTFIGPSAAAIRAMGLKDAAKTLMDKAGVPVVPGYHGADQDGEMLAREAEAIGYPVLIKAVAGGGGKGMRRVEGPGEFAAALSSARSEARAAFGNDAVLIEKYIAAPRHIEVQVFGDGHEAVHLFERDCSLQRRHQKVIEEAPAPGMSAEMRAAMGEAATRAAKAIGYAGAGTVEFIVDGSDGLRADRFWFMEMNTRLQVEHPVTEEITGVDLVEWQLRVASGEGLPAAQEDLSINGHAFEARLYAEDPAKGFLPATGRLDHLQFAPGARIDSGVRQGDDISPFYDPMIAKITTHGPTRAAALGALARALEGTEVAGTVTNLGFLGALARHEGFGRGEVDTGLIEREGAALGALGTPRAELVAAAALVAADPGAGFALWAPLRQSVTLSYAGAPEGEPHRVAYELDGQGATVFIEELSHEPLRLQRAGDGWAAPGQSHGVRAIRHGASVTVFDKGAAHVFDIVDPLDVESASAGGGLIDAPMPGLVRDIMAAPGQEVAEGAPLAILEAMKMEHVLTAARDGVVAEVFASPGDQVEAGAPLIRLEDEEEEEDA